MSNKERILDCALQLFNDKGSSVISTNHIASETNISPGNLYYHFKNKEAIILSLFEQMVAEWESSEHTATLSIESQLGRVFETVWKYRFIHRELSPLVQNYPSIKSYCTPILQKRLFEIKGMITMLEEQSVLIALDEETRDYLSNALLMIPLFWQGYIDVIGKPATKANVEQGIQMMKQLIRPYLA